MVTKANLRIAPAVVRPKTSRPALRALACLVAGVAIVVAVLGPAQAEEVVLKAQSALPRQHDLTASFLKLFVEPLNTAGEGIVRIDYIGGPEATPANKAAPALKRGVFDLLHTPATYHVGIVPQGLAMMATNLYPAEYRANGGFDLLAPNWQTKLNATIVGIGETGAQFYLYTSRKPPLKDGMVDLTGFKMRTTGAYRPLLEALNATTVQIPAGEVYTALQRDVIDGFGWPTVSLDALGLAKAVKYRIDPPFYHLANVVLINLDTWKAMPQEARDLVTKIARQYEETSIRHIQATALVDDKAVREQGVEVFQMDAAGSKAFLERAYDAMWARVEEKLGAEETGMLREKMYRAQ